MARSKVRLYRGCAGLFGILVYVAFRYEYSFAVAAVVAILHDVAMTGGLFSYLGVTKRLDSGGGLDDHWFLIKLS